MEETNWLNMLQTEICFISAPDAQSNELIREPPPPELVQQFRL